MMQISKNTVLITGGAKGIGLALAQAFLRAGNEVIICGRNKNTLAQAKQQLPGLHIYECDICDVNQQQSMQALLSTKFPRLNLLINNAGVQNSLNFKHGDFNSQTIADEISTNLTGHIQLTHRLLPLLQSQPHSTIAFVSSALARVPKKSAPVYDASKAGIHSFTRALRYQLEETRVKVIEVVPDLVDTAMTEGNKSNKKMAPEKLAHQVLRAMAKGKEEILIGRTGILFFIHRLFPQIAYKIIKNN